LHVAEQRYLVAQDLRDGVIGAAEYHVRLYADAAQFVHAVLGGLGLELLGGGDIRQVGDMYIERVIAAHLVAHLPDGLEEGLALDIAHRAADLHDDDLRLGNLRHLANAALYLVGDVRYHLYGAAQVVPAPLPGYHRGVDLAGGDVGGRRQVGVDKTLVVPQVEVGFRAVGGDEDLAMLVGGHGAGVHIQVGVELLHRNRDVAAFEDAADGSCGDAFAHRTDHAACHKNIFSHSYSLLLCNQTRVKLRFAGDLNLPGSRVFLKPVVIIDTRNSVCQV